MSKHNLAPYMEMYPNVPKHIVKGAFEEAVELLGSGYTTEYYWQSMAKTLCDFYEMGRSAEINNLTKVPDETNSRLAQEKA